MAKVRPTDKEQAIQEAIDVLVSQGRDVTTAAVLSHLLLKKIADVKPGDVHQSAAWKNLVAQEKGKSETAVAATIPAAPRTIKNQPTQERPMAKTEKKHAFPSRPCPKCGKPIHPRSKSHPACGWVMSNGQGTTATAKPAGKKKVGRPKKIHATKTGGPITFQDIAAVKGLVDKLGAEKVQQLAQVLV